MRRYSHYAGRRSSPHAWKRKPPTPGNDVANPAQPESLLHLPWSRQVHPIQTSRTKLTSRVVNVYFGLLGRRNGTGPLIGRASGGMGRGGRDVSCAFGLKEYSKPTMPR